MTRRLRLTRPAAERLLGLCGARAPWRTPRAAAPALGRLGPPPATGPGETPDAELARLGALTPAGVPADLAAALRRFAEPAVLIDVDLVVRRAGGDARLHSWQRPSEEQVVALSTTGGDVELAWHHRDAWPLELARTPAAVVAPVVRGVPLTAPLTVPRQLLVATGAARRAGRDDLADVLAQQVAPVPDLAGLHDCRARLRVVATGPERVGWLGWVLLADGWRELTADRTDVRLTPVTPTRLGERVERLVNGVLR